MFGDAGHGLLLLLFSLFLIIFEVRLKPHMDKSEVCLVLPQTNLPSFNRSCVTQFSLELTYFFLELGVLSSQTMRLISFDKLCDALFHSCWQVNCCCLLDNEHHIWWSLLDSDDGIVQYLLRSHLQ